MRIAVDISYVGYILNKIDYFLLQFQCVRKMNLAKCANHYFSNRDKQINSYISPAT